MSGKNPIPRELSYEGVRASNPPEIISAKRPPNTNDFKYPIGTFWINTVSQISYQLLKNPGIWGVCAAGAGGDLSTLTTDDLNVIPPTLDNITIAGGTNINTTGNIGTSTVTVSTSANPTFTSATVTLGVTAATLTASTSITANGAGSRIGVHGGAVTDFIGSGVLVAGTVTIANTNITAADRIFLSRSVVGGTLGNLSYTISAATSFTINSSSNTETSTIAYLIIRQTA